jgi:hypothetical protein
VNVQMKVHMLSTFITHGHAGLSTFFVNSHDQERPHQIVNLLGNKLH